MKKKMWISLLDSFFGVHKYMARQIHKNELNMVSQLLN
jgi:hypothetical protein